MNALVRVLQKVVLPAEITSFERSYVARINRIALWFFVAHIPLFSLIAGFNETGALMAALLTGLGVLGPALAMRTVQNPRVVSTIFGVTAMYMGALLVHFGRGIWTMEMHFYFFVALALLAVFANPMVIVVAAVTVALHHLLFWAIAPQSLFNYEAPVSSVLVHAVFVVLESVAAAFVARSFFDNVVGLERIVGARTAALDARNRDMALVFDNVQQGFLMVKATGELSAEHSKVVQTWVRAPQAGEHLWTFFKHADPSFASWLQLGWSSLVDDFMPREVALAQLPAKLIVGGRTLEVAYQAVERAGVLEQVLVLLTDATARLQREAADLEQRETMQVFERLMRDRAGFLEFFAESRELISSLDQVPCPLNDTVQRRIIHTLKGNCAVFGVASIAQVCHDLESQVVERSIEAADRAALVQSWRTFSERVVRFLDEGHQTSLIELDEGDYRSIVHAINEGTSRIDVLRQIESWKNEPVRKRFERLASQAKALARRLGRGDLTVEIDVATLRLPRAHFGKLWASMVHVIRNAVDHGIPPVDKQATAPKLTLSAVVSGDVLRVSVGDNGSGVNWSKVAAAAAKQGLPTGSAHDLEEALFADGLTTADQTTDVSGRGVGLSAVRDACRELGGEVHVHSASSGTRFDFEFPARLVYDNSTSFDLLESRNFGLTLPNAN